MTLAEKIINLRNTPELHFVMDQSIAYGVDMSRKIDEVVKDMVSDEEDLDEDIFYDDEEDEES